MEERAQELCRTNVRRKAKLNQSDGVSTQVSRSEDSEHHRQIMFGNPNSQGDCCLLAPETFRPDGVRSFDTVLSLDLVAVHLLPERRARNLKPLCSLDDVTARIAKDALDLPLLRRIPHCGEREDGIDFID